MSNRLKNSSSPYLQAHAENPIDWYPWGPEALQKAKDEDKPIFLSIGYSACHWCHVMEKESFSSPKTAEILNELFVSIKVDREERPDIDKISMQSVLMMTGRGGWPLTVWLTPELKPFYGGTYFPDRPQPGTASLAQLLLSIAHSWKNQRDQILASADKLQQALVQLEQIAVTEEDQPTDDSEVWLEKALEGCHERYDERNGGFGYMPKFPQPMLLRFLLLHSLEFDDGELFELVDHSAEAMARGGLFDQLGGGFHRYCIDAGWTVPHFEKMLYDNALMLDFYAELYGATRKPLYRWVCETLIAWLQREMRLEDGGYAASQDADTDQGEGSTFRWTPQDLEGILEKNEQQIFRAFYEVTENGNFADGSTVLSQRQTLSRCAKSLGWDFELAVSVLGKAKEKAFEARLARPQPARDDKLIAGWNGLLLSGLCRAARHLDSPDLLKTTCELGSILATEFGTPGPQGEVHRYKIGGQTQGRATSEDLGSLVLGFFDLYELTLEDQWMTAALRLFQVLQNHFWDPDTHLTALTSPLQDDLPHRPFSFEDNATPSGHSLFLECCRRHHQFTGSQSSADLLKNGLEAIRPLLERAPTGLGLALQTTHLSALTPQHLLLTVDRSQAPTFLQVLQQKVLPGLTVLHSATPGIDPTLTEGRVEGFAYLCLDQACQPPAATPEELVERFEQALQTA